MHEPKKILVVEDDHPFYFVLQRNLYRIEELSFDIEHVETLKDACEALTENEYAFALLDLTLPDSERIDTLERIKPFTTACPIIVLTALSDIDMGVLALKHGVEDYLIKDEICSGGLARSIRYAIERFNLRKIIDDIKIKQELASVENISKETSSLAKKEELDDFKVRDSVSYTKAVNMYVDILNAALAQKVHGKDGSLSEKIKTFSEVLTERKATPKDFIQVHSTALKNLIATSPKPKAQAYIEESRIIGLEAMGYLAHYYRNYALNTSQTTTH